MCAYLSARHSSSSRLIDSFLPNYITSNQYKPYEYEWENMTSPIWYLLLHDEMYFSIKVKTSFFNYKHIPRERENDTGKKVGETFSLSQYK